MSTNSPRIRRALSKPTPGRAPKITPDAAKHATRQRHSHRPRMTTPRRVTPTRVNPMSLVHSDPCGLSATFLALNTCSAAGREQPNLADADADADADAKASHGQAEHKESW